MASTSTVPVADSSDALVLQHRRLACHLAQRYVRGGDQREDLEQAAYLGLVKAARRFDPNRGVAFTTFAMPTILGELRRFCRDTRWGVHVPRAVQEQVQALRRLEDEHRTHHGRAPSAAEAARALDWSEEEVLEARLAANCLSLESLNTPLRSPDGTAGETIDAIGSEDTGFADAERRDELRRALAHLRPAERRALRLRGEGGFSTPEIARCMGISRSQAARLVTAALAELRAALGGHVNAVSGDEPVVGLVDADAELFAALDADALTRARRTAIAPRLTLEPGPWEGPEAGMLVISGALLRMVAVDGHPRAELIGPGDFVPSTGNEVLARAVWQVVEPVELAVLDSRVVGVLCAWPSVMGALLARAAERSNALAVQLAITDQRRVDDRLLSLFRVLGARWGRRTAGGVDISLPLTHETIAMLVGAHRPTVTSALRRLSRAGRLRRVRARRWLLSDAEAPRLPLAA